MATIHKYLHCSQINISLTKLYEIMAASVLRMLILILSKCLIGQMAYLVELWSFLLFYCLIIWILIINRLLVLEMCLMMVLWRIHRNNQRIGIKMVIIWVKIVNKYTVHFIQNNSQHLAVKHYLWILSKEQLI